MTQENSTNGSGVQAGIEPSFAPPRRRWGRTALRLFLLIVIPAIALSGGAYWYEISGRYISTENAYVKTHVIAVSPNIDGRVISVEVRENQLTRRGDTLFRLNPDPHRLTIERAEAKLATVRQQIEATRAEYRQIEAEIEKAQSNVTFHHREATRQRALARKGVTTKTRLEEAEHNLNSAHREVATLKQKLRTVLARLGGAPDKAAEQQPAYREVVAEIDMAKLALDYTEVRAPADGIVTRLNLEPGEWVKEGAPTFGIIATDQVWIEANLKETQLTHVREGQMVEVQVDAYPDTVWRARVASISPATGAEFAVLPPQNASGNWVKVVQRLPVRIEIERNDSQPPLRAGMTAAVTIDTHHERRLLGAVTEALAKFGDDKR